MERGDLCLLNLSEAASANGVNLSPCMVGTYKRFNVKGHSTQEVRGPFFRRLDVEGPRESTNGSCDEPVERGHLAIRWHIVFRQFAVRDFL